MTSDTTPTDRWLAAVADQMPALPGPAGVAERLLLLAHYGVDWEHGWIGSRRALYWERILPDRVVVATFRAATLPRWWEELAGELGTAPRNAQERMELQTLLRTPAPAVLEVLRLETEALLLRTRITADAVRQTRVAVAS